MRASPSSALLRRIVVINGVVFAVGTFVLAVSPATVSAPIVLTEIPVLIVGLALILAANALLLRRSLAPLGALVGVMERVDLLRPTDRVTDRGNGDLTQLIATFHTMLDRLAAERSASSGHALAAQEAERRRIARELHDEIGQSLTAALLALKRTVDRAPEDLRPDLCAVQETVRASLDEVRHVARRLRPDVLEDLGLISALASLGTEFGAELGTVARDIDPDLPQLSPEVELVVFRVAQEALTNVARHAGADSVALRLRRGRGGAERRAGQRGTGRRRDDQPDADRRDAEFGGVELTVVDDGLGGAVTEGAGIRGMRERALLVGGTLTLTSPPGRGTEVRLVVPQAGGFR